MSLDRHRLSDLASGAPVYWLLELTWSGGTIRLSELPIETTADDGTIRAYFAGLGAVEVTEAIDLLADMDSSGASVAIEAVFPVDIAALAARGHDLSSAVGELSQWVEGTSWDERRVVMIGSVSDPIYGTQEEGARFSLRAQVWQDESLVPAATNAVLAENFDNAMILSLAPEDKLLAYPEIVGRPGLVSTSLASAGWCSASRMVWVDKQKILRGADFSNLTGVVAGHHVTATEVYANNDTHTAGYRFKVHNAYDRRGHPVAIIPAWVGLNAPGDDPYNYDAASPYTWGGFPPYGLGVNALPASYQPVSGTAANIYVGWKDDATGGGGMRARDGSTLERAADVLEQWLFPKLTLPIDHGRCAAAADLLGGVKLAFTVDTATSPWAFAKSNILPLLPVTIVSGPSGLYPLVWRFWATSADAVHRLDADKDPGIERTSGVSTDRQTIYNDFSLEYGYTVRTGTYRGKARLGALGLDVGLPSLHCTLSQQRYKRPDGQPLVVENTIQSPIIYDDQSARIILEWRAAAYALARRRITYELPVSRYGNVERGQVITITDSAMSLSSEVALLESVRWNGSPVLEVTLLLIEDPARTLNATG